MNINEINYKEYEVSTPYPKITKNERDADTIKKLINIYAGYEGELTASTQYIYQSFIVKPANEHFHELLEKIAIKEMTHLELVSQLLLSMGVNPKYCTYIDNNSSICNNWSANNVKYITDWIEFIKYDIKLEKDAIRDYNEIINTTPIANVKEVVSRIVEDEESHLALFNAMLNAIQNN